MKTPSPKDGRRTAWPNQAEGYGDITTSIEAAAFERAVEVPENPEEDPYKDAKYDENTACWGGTNDGFIVKSTEEIDFGNGEFQQLVPISGMTAKDTRSTWNSISTK